MGVVGLLNQLLINSIESRYGSVVLKLPVVYSKKKKRGQISFICSRPIKNPLPVFLSLQPISRKKLIVKLGEARLGHRYFGVILTFIFLSRAMTLFEGEWQRNVRAS